MRAALILVLCTFFFGSFSQKAVIQGNIRDSSGRGRPVNTELHFLKNDTVINTGPSSSYKIYLNKFMTDTLVVTNSLLGTMKIPIKLYKGSLTTLDITFPKSCRSLNVTNICPKCKSTKDIVNIVYGMPTEKTMKRAEKEEIHLGGCMIDDCSPHYYCKKDKLEF